MNTTEDIRQELIRKYRAGEFRVLGDSTKTVEIQNAHFVCDKDWVIREPNYDYANREIEWYKSQSLFVEDIPGKTPAIWESCADEEGKINSNYGWCIWSNENGNQYKSCIRTLTIDPHSRQAVMLYTRPSMQNDSHKNGMRDFMCTFSTQMFLNDTTDGNYTLKYIVYMRSNDAVFGFDNDVIWHKYVQNRMCEELSMKLGKEITPEPIEWNAASFHVYERHFKFLEEE